MSFALTPRRRPASGLRTPRLRPSIEDLEPRALLSATLVKDVNTQPANSNPTEPTSVNGTVFFAATDPDAGTELWKTDGTPFGTDRVADINPGPAGSVPQSLTAVGSTLFFTAIRGGADRELWKTDGTQRRHRPRERHQPRPHRLFPCPPRRCEQSALLRPTGTRHRRGTVEKRRDRSRYHARGRQASLGTRHVSAFEDARRNRRP